MGGRGNAPGPNGASPRGPTPPPPSLGFDLRELFSPPWYVTFNCSPVTSSNLNEITPLSSST